MTTYTRAAWGARPADGGPGPLTPSRVEGIALHWPAMSAPLRTVEAVKAALRSWQSYHMDDKGWSDIGYQVAVDQAGNRYELRGLATQSGANGGTDVNQRFGAVLLVVAPGEEPSTAMVAEVRRVIADHRRLFPNSTRIVGHSDIRPEPTTCPGPAVSRGIRAGVFNPAAQEADMFTADEFVEALARAEFTTYDKDKAGENVPRRFDVILAQIHYRAQGARTAATTALRGQRELAKLIKTLPGAGDELKALADDIVARTAAEVDRLDAEAVAEQLQITTKRQEQ